MLQNQCTLSLFAALPSFTSCTLTLPLLLVYVRARVFLCTGGDAQWQNRDDYVVQLQGQVVGPPLLPSGLHLCLPD